MRRVGLIAIFAAILTTVPLFSYAQSPLIIVNGQMTELTDLKAINPEDIERIETEPVDEESIERYGTRANNGIVHVTLKYDRSARFKGEGSFDEAVESLVKWKSDETAARVVVRYTIAESGCIVVGEVIESTDSRLKRRVLAAMEEFVKEPMWEPAVKQGEPVATERVLQIQLPHGKRLPRQPYIILL